MKDGAERWGAVPPASEAGFAVDGQARPAWAEQWAGPPVGPPGVNLGDEAQWARLGSNSSVSPEGLDGGLGTPEQRTPKGGLLEAQRVSAELRSTA